MIPGKIFGNKEMRLLMLGLDAAGKTSECITVICSRFCSMLKGDTTKRSFTSSN